MNRTNHHVFSFFRNNFIAGITALLPLWVVYLVVKLILTSVNNALLEPIQQVVLRYLEWADPRYLTVVIKTVIFITILCLIVMLGVMVKNFFVRKILGIGESVLMKIPFVNKIYVAIQQISRTIFYNKQSFFSKVVLVQYPMKGTYVAGLVTSETNGEIQEKTKRKLINVFVPTTPNPTSGFLLFVPREEIIELEMTVEDSLKMIISFGGVVPVWPLLKK